MLGESSLRLQGSWAGPGSQRALQQQSASARPPPNVSPKKQDLILLHDDLRKHLSGRMNGGYGKLGESYADLVFIVANFPSNNGP